ncbi:MAG: TonB-dependent receptor [Deltaproteobacteria bacterium]|nr:TonB-dependent receptor [Deltaproteobacteria bacterium]
MKRGKSHKRTSTKAPTTFPKILFCICLFGLWGSAEWTHADTESSLFDLPLEELMNISVVSASREPDQPLFKASAAVYVITDEDIRRSGHLGLPEQLRMVPGMHVARIDGNKWAIAARGDNDRFSRNLLVQMDGRTLYSPIYSGVYWEYQDTVLENIDRIEVVRGPGGTLWESSAVNGIVNIVTKPAGETQGWLFSGGIGSEERGFGTVQYGGRISEDTYYRIYAKHREQDETDVYDARYTDDRGLSQVGFRLDRGHGTDAGLTLQGDYFRARISDSQITLDAERGINGIAVYDNLFEGINLLGRWNRTLSEISKIQLQVYGDWSWLDDSHPDVSARFLMGVYDLEFQHNLHISERHRLVWGTSYRTVTFKYRNTPKVTFDPTYRRESTYTAFLQYTITLVPERLDFITGTKIEHNEYTDFEFNPTLRLVWTPHENHTLWAAATRTIKPAAMIYNFATIHLTALRPDTTLSIIPDRNNYLMKVQTLELGYRVRPAPRLSLDIAAFFNDIEKRLGSGLVNDAPPTLSWDDAPKGRSYGVEVSATLQVHDRWRLLAGYSWFHYDVYNGADEAIEKASPDHQVQLRSYYDISRNLECNVGVYYYDAVSSHNIDPYIRLDVGLTWRPGQNLEISLWGQNLLDDKHPEYRQDDYVAAGAGEIQHSWYTKLTWRY